MAAQWSIVKIKKQLIKGENMSEVRSKGDFARVQKVLENGEVKRIQAYVTSDILLKKGQTIYLNPLEESFDMKVKNNIISESDAAEQLSSIAKRDSEYDRQTTHVCRAVEPQAKKG